MILRQLDILFYPPAINLLLLIVALLLWRKRNLSFTLISISTVTLFVFSLPITSNRLAVLLEKHPAIPPAQLTSYPAQAIVVLGAGATSHTDEYQTSSLEGDALMRVRYAAYIHRLTGLPVFASGGRQPGERSEAETMQAILQTEFHSRQVIAEESSMTTYENAIQTARLLKKKNINNIFLVTSSLHMNRSVNLFRQQDLEVIPAPTNLYSNHDIEWRYFIPNGDALRDTRAVLHEFAGISWYWLRAQPGI